MTTIKSSCFSSSNLSPTFLCFSLSSLIKSRLNLLPSIEINLQLLIVYSDYNPYKDSWQARGVTRSTLTEQLDMMTSVCRRMTVL